jgi:hypothetical protein
MVYEKYFQVMQEGSERVCGTALPVEIIHLILFKWGGLMHPTAAIIQGLILPLHNVYGFNVQVIPHGSISPEQIVGSIQHDQLDGEAVRLIYITLHKLLCEKNATESSPNAGDSFTMLRDGSVLVCSRSIEMTRLLYRDITDEGTWWAADELMFEDGIHSSKMGLWTMAAACRGWSIKNCKVLCNTHRETDVTKAELCALLRRAETDNSFKFWYDMANVFPKVTIAYGTGVSIGVIAGVAVIGLGGWGVKKLTPLPYPEAVLTFIFVSRSVSMLGSFGWDYMLKRRRLIYNVLR